MASDVSIVGQEQLDGIGDKDKVKGITRHENFDITNENLNSMSLTDKSSKSKIVIENCSFRKLKLNNFDEVVINSSFLGVLKLSRVDSVKISDSLVYNTTSNKGQIVEIWEVKNISVKNSKFVKDGRTDSEICMGIIQSNSCDFDGVDIKGFNQAFFSLESEIMIKDSTVSDCSCLFDVKKTSLGIDGLEISSVVDLVSKDSILSSCIFTGLDNIPSDLKTAILTGKL